jgi:hypothetical protein
MGWWLPTKLTWRKVHKYKKIQQLLRTEFFTIWNGEAGRRMYFKLPLFSIEMDNTKKYKYSGDSESEGCIQSLHPLSPRWVLWLWVGKLNVYCIHLPIGYRIFQLTVTKNGPNAWSSSVSSSLSKTSLPWSTESFHRVACQVSLATYFTCKKFYEFVITRRAQLFRLQGGHQAHVGGPI